ncbi:MAG: acyl carrier protein [Crocosphaera sp.]
MTDDQAYNLQIIKKVITSYLDEKIPNNERGLNMLVDQCDDLVYKIASKIYTESGHKVELSIILNVINDRVETLKRHFAEIKAEEKRKKYEEKNQYLAKKAFIKQIDKSRLSDLSKKLTESRRSENLAYIFSQVQYIVSEQLEIELEKITIDSNIEDLGADSLDSVELIMEIEEHFDIEVTDNFFDTRGVISLYGQQTEIYSFTVGQMLDGIVQLMAED